MRRNMKCTVFLKSAHPFFGSDLPHICLRLIRLLSWIRGLEELVLRLLYKTMITAF
jgi:hypothetical protein